MKALGRRIFMVREMTKKRPVLAKIKEFFRTGTYNELVAVVLIVSLVIAYIAYEKNKINKHGVFAIAKVLRYEGAASGGSLYIEIYLGGKTYNATVGNACFRCTGDYYFVKVLKKDPSDNVIFYDESRVLDCIFTKPIPKDGWKKFPVCDDPSIYLPEINPVFE